LFCKGAAATGAPVRELSSYLGDRSRYLEQIDRLHLKYSQRQGLFELEQDGVTLASLCLERKKVARLLAETVSVGAYELQPARARLLNIDGKPRMLYLLRLTDRIVHGVVAKLINERMEPFLSPRVYSYRKSQHWWRAVADFARYLREHRRARPNAKTRGLYVMRRDIEKYTDTIPVGNQSVLWSRLKELLQLDPDREARSSRHWKLIQNIVRPETRSEEGSLYCNIRGVPTGSPISTTLFNLYLMPLDNALATIPEGFYARYSDDVLFAHPDPSIVQEAIDRLGRILQELQLSTNKSKDQDIYFNGAGRAPTDWRSAQGTSRVAFLGCNVSFDGTVSLKPKKARQLLREIRCRAQRTLRALPGEEPGAAGPVVCSAINESLEPASVYRQKSALLLRSVVTSRAQLKELDYQIARIISGTLVGSASPRAFRRISYRTLRQNWQLVSLYHRRNCG
jgi:reverse transcriptase-like protein